MGDSYCRFIYVRQQQDYLSIGEDAGGDDAGGDDAGGGGARPMTLVAAPCPDRAAAAV